MKPFYRILCPFLGLCVFLFFISTTSAQVDWPNLKFTQVGNVVQLPTYITHAGDGSGRLFVLEQAGYIRIIKNDNQLAEPFLNLTDRVSNPFGSEDGLLSLAFPTNYAANGRFYVYYNRKPDGACVLSRFNVSTNADLANPLSEQILLTIPETYGTHNGGFLSFGPDGCLYLGTGDSTMDDTFPSFAQNPSSLWGKILRLDVESLITNSYLVPSNNPFVGNTNYAPEIWALGFRNPVRGSFDKATGDLYLGDVGQNSVEEINFLPAPIAGGKNFGWKLLEGNQDYNVPIGFNRSLLTAPIAEFFHSDGYSSLTAGSVYHGPSDPRMNGLFFYGDYFSGILGALKRVGTNWKTQTLSNSGLFIVAFGEDESGRLYLADYQFFGSSAIYRVEDNGQVYAPEFTPPPVTSFTTNIILTCLSPGATIHYSTNGIDPTPASPSVASGGMVSISSGTQLRAQAYRNDLAPSDVVIGFYTFRVATPTFSPSQGPISNGTFIAIQSATPGVDIHYTIDGSSPSTNSPLYTGPLALNTSQTLKAKGYKAGFADSFVGTFDANGLRLTGVTIDTNKNLVFTWQSVPNFTYQIQYSTDLQNWHNEGVPMVGNGNILSYASGSALPALQRRFFRILVSTL